MFGLAQTQASTPATRLLPRANQSLAKHNRKSPQTTQNNHQQPKSIASFCRVFRAHSPRRNSPPALRLAALPAARCIPARACASIRDSAGSCAQPPGGGAVMMYASLYMSEWTSALSPYEMPIRSGVCGEWLRGRMASRAKAPCLRRLTAGLKPRPSYTRAGAIALRMDGGLKTAATKATSTPGHFPFPISFFRFLLSIPPR
jgi:hypothetical protein